MTGAKKERRSGIRIMAQLIGLVKPLLHIMTAAILLGVLGYLCAIFLTILAGQAILKGSGQNLFLLQGKPSLCGTILQPFYCL